MLTLPPPLPSLPNQKSRSHAENEAQACKVPPASLDQATRPVWSLLFLAARGHEENSVARSGGVVASGHYRDLGDGLGGYLVG